MRKIVISYSHLTKAEQPLKTKNSARINTHRYGKKLNCSKCGARLRVGDVAYRTARKFLCKECGEHTEI